MENKYTKEEFWDFIESFNNWGALAWAIQPEVTFYLSLNKVDEAFRQFIKGFKSVICPPISGTRDRNAELLIKLLFCSLEEMPLMINKRDKFIQQLAQWRLSHGK